jgi:histidine racemase
MGTIICHIFDPIGNITGIVSTSIPRENQPAIAKQLMETLQLEQVGFLENINNKENNLLLQMMGGEFSGNGLAAIGMYLSQIDEKQTRWMVKSSGITDSVALQNLSAIGLELAPRKINLIKVSVLLKYNLIEISKNTCIVDFGGISHMVILDEDPKSYSDTEILGVIKKEFKQEQLAYGVIVAKKRAEGWAIAPTIYVPSVGSLVREQACASGSIALAIYLVRGYKFKQKNFPVYQPNGKKIKILIDQEAADFVKVSFTVHVKYLGEKAFKFNE